MTEKNLSALNTLLVGIMLGLCALPAQALRFNSYVNEQGQTVYSNVPKQCIRGQLMTCGDQHPVMSGQADNRPAVANAPVARSDGKRRAAQPKQSAGRHTVGMPGSSAQVNEDSLFSILNQVSEMNALLDEYFPGNPDPEELARVRQQQEGILEILQGIKKAATSEQQSSIEKAIDILRSNLAH